MVGSVGGADSWACSRPAGNVTASSTAAAIPAILFDGQNTFIALAAARARACMNPEKSDPSKTIPLGTLANVNFRLAGLPETR